MQKYGRTFHLPTSPGVQSDDKRLRSTADLVRAAEAVFTEKMDGENTTIHHTGCHARSPDSGYHASRDWMKAFAAGISPQLAPGERIIGEYLFAKHAIAYVGLPSYFLGFAWVLNGVTQSWDATTARFEALGVHPVPVLRRGPFSDEICAEVAASLDPTTQEGFVVRDAGAFPEAAMATHLAKYVRAGHVQTETHWRNAPIIRNALA